MNQPLQAVAVWTRVADFDAAPRQVTFVGVGSGWPKAAQVGLLGLTLFVPLVQSFG